MNTSTPERSTRRDSVRRASIAGLTAALLAGSALGAAPGMQSGVAWAEEAPAAAAPADAATTTPPANQTAPVTVNGAPLYAPEAPAEQGVAVAFGIPGAYDTTGAEALLNRINEIRAEAAAEGIAIEGVPVSGAPLQWSATLEGIAQTRAAEASFSLSAERPNGLGPVTSQTGNTFGTPVALELLDMAGAPTEVVESWYAEKQAYLTYLQTGVDTGDFGHYKALISDAYTTVGIGSFAASAPAEGGYAIGGPVLAVELASSGNDAATPADGVAPDGTATPAAVRPDGTCVQQINVKAADYLSGAISGEAALQAGTTTQLSASVESGANKLGGQNLVAGTVTPLVANLTWASDNEAVATVDGAGLLSGIAEGGANISLVSNGTAVATLPITVAAAPVTITAVSNPAEITTDAGVAPVLPTMLTATMSDGSTSEVPVSWDAVDPALYGGRGGGAFDVTGVAEGFPVVAHVIVNPAAATGASLAATSIEVQAGNVPELPALATVTWSNGETSEEAVTWDALDTSSYPEGGTAELTGYVGETGLTVSCTVNILAPAPVLISVPDVTGQSEAAAVETLTNAGLAPTVTYSEAAPSAEQAGVVYQVDPAAGTQVEAGASVTLVVYGAYVPPMAAVPELVGWDTVAATEALANAGLTANVVTGEAAPNAEQAGVIYQVDPVAGTQVETGSTVTLTAYGEYVPPKPVMVGVPDVMGKTGDEATQALEAAGLVAGIKTGDPAPSAEQAGLVYHVDPATEAQVEVGSTVTLTVYGEYVAPKPDTISVPDVMGQSAEAAQAALENAGLNVYLKAGDAAPSADKAGIVYQMDPKTGDQVEAGGTVTLNVYGEYVAPKPIPDSANAPKDITITAGETPKLPEKVTVVWSDGSTTEEAVSWESAPENAYAKPGTVTLNGTVADTGLSVKVNVIVEAAPEPTPLTITKVAQPAAVTTPAGTAPALPKNAAATMSDGSTAELPVSWNEVDPSLYDGPEANTFSVAGTVADEQGATTSLSVDVNVERATATDIAPLSGVTTREGVAPELPTMAEVTWSSGQVTGEAIEWDEIAKDAYAAAGTFKATGTVLATSTDITCEVTVIAPTITGQAGDVTVETASGTAPELPSRIKMTYDDGKARAANVTWEQLDKEAYSAREGGTLEVHGNVEGWDGTVVATVTVTPAAIASASVHNSVTTPAGTAPELPATASVMWTNGDTSNEPVEWTEIEADQYRDAGTFEVEGVITPERADKRTVTCAVTVTPATITEVEGATGEIVTPSGTAPALPDTLIAHMSNGTEREVAVSWEAIDKQLYTAREGGTFEVTGTIEGWDADVTMTVKVEPATPQSAAKIEGVTTPAGTAPKLLATVKVTWSNGDVTDETITWGEIDPKSYLEGGTFEAAGTVGTDKTGQLKVSCTVTVQPAFISGIEASVNVTTPSGTPPKLPATVTAQMSNGTKKDVSVTWETVKDASWQAHDGGTFEVKGTVEGWDAPITLKVTVSPATITEVVAPSALTVKEGAKPELPTTVKVTWSNGDVTDEAVSWKGIAEDAYAKPGTVTLNGTVEGWGKDVTLEIVVEALVATKVEQPAAVTTAAGTAPVLPATVKVTWDNGAVTDEAVTWDAVDEASYHNGGTFTVNGKIGTAPDQAVSIQVSVSDATASSAVAVEVSTPAGIAPTLPATVKVTWSNGDVTDEAVSWHAVDATRYAVPGSFTIEGAFSNTKVTFKASAKVTVDEAVITGVDIVPAVSTVAGVAPKLPETVTVTKSDGSRASVPVTWQTPDPAQYKVRGIFTLTGTVEGFDGEASITVKVASATVSSVQQQIAVTTPVGVKPELPATVQFTWSDGSTTNETVTWDRVDEALYQKVGSFQVKGVASGWSVTATVSVEQADVPKTGDASLSLPAIITAGVAGAAAALGGVIALVRKRIRG